MDTVASVRKLHLVYVLSEVFFILVVIVLGICISSLCRWVNDFHKLALAVFYNLCS